MPPMPRARGSRWRTVDIVVTAVLGVAFGVVFWAWNLLWSVAGAAGLLPAAPGAPQRRLPDARRRRAGLLVRKPGAAHVRLDARRGASACCSARRAALIIVVYGLVQGAGARARLPADPLPPLRLGARPARRGHGRAVDVDPRPEPLLPGLAGLSVLGVHAAVHAGHGDLQRAARRRRRPAAGPGPGPHRRASSFASGRTPRLTGAPVTTTRGPAPGGPAPQARARAVVARGLGVRHASRRAWALTGVDLVVEPGERVLLTGASGAGQVHAARGAGRDPRRRGRRGDRRAHRRRPRRRGPPADRLGLLAQDPDSQLVMTRAGDDVAFGLENAGAARRDEIWPRVDEALAAVGFPYGRDRPTQALSGGEKQRLVLAGALARRPGLLLLDEPTAQLDPPGAALVRAAVARVDRRPQRHHGRRRPRRRPVAAAGGPGRRGGPGRAGRARPRLATGLPHRRPATCRPRPDGTGPARRAGRRLHLPRERRPRRCRPPTRALRGGRALAVTGPNGTGKSTLALLLAGLRAPTTGRVEAAGGARRGRAEGLPRAAPLAGGGAGQPDRHGLPAPRAAVPHRPAARRARAGAAALRPSTPRPPTPRPRSCSSGSGSTAFADANPYTLSGGQQRRLSVATALATSPRVLVLDEPTFGQDARHLARAGHPARRAAGRAAARSPSSPTTPTWCDVLADDRLRCDGVARRSARRRTRRCGRINPVAQLAAIAVVTLVLLTSLDVVTPAVVVAAELCLLPAAGLTSPRDLLAPHLAAAARRASVGAGQRAPRPTTRRVVTGVGLGAARRRAGAAGRAARRLHRPGPAGRRADHALAGVHPVRLRRAGRAAAGPAAGRRVRVGPAGPPHPRRGGRPQPGGPGPAVRRASRSRCWSAPSAAGPGWRRRWTPAASTPASPAPTRAARGCTRGTPSSSSAPSSSVRSRSP